MPLASSFVLSKQKGNEAWIKPVYIITMVSHDQSLPITEAVQKQDWELSYFDSKCANATELNEIVL